MAIRRLVGVFMGGIGVCMGVVNRTWGWVIAAVGVRVVQRRLDLGLLMVMTGCRRRRCHHIGSAVVGRSVLHGDDDFVEHVRHYDDDNDGDDDGGGDDDGCDGGNASQKKGSEGRQKPKAAFVVNINIAF